MQTKGFKLGKLPKREDRFNRTLKLRHYLPGGKKEVQLPTPPDEVSWITKVPRWPMHLNDVIGDCTVAAAAHMIEQWTYYATGREVIVSDRDVLTAYSAVSGYIPDDPNNPQANATDNGAYLLDVLNYWRKTGIGGYKIDSFVQVDINEPDEIQWAIELFGNVYVGILLPVSAQDQANWTVTDGGIYSPNGVPGSWGGHCIPSMARSPLTTSIISWGMASKMSHAFWTDYVDEAYAVSFSLFDNRQKLDSIGFDVSKFKRDLERVTS